MELLDAEEGGGSLGQGLSLSLADLSPPYWLFPAWLPSTSLVQTHTVTKIMHTTAQGGVGMEGPMTERSGYGVGRRGSEPKGVSSQGASLGWAIQSGVAGGVVSIQRYLQRWRQ